ncbi:MAG: TonB-dependent receptor [Alphaproteobacteria bacterium]|nr:TonB-dependent receptor [Alphaproteobacteria bacterium]MBU0865294.1 TonB-dependent receptor [Alphaproteobacteria bacterium]MBU1823553.1 TonB-dependent receptor [Alphaproteobacteria bacterium]
MKKTQFSKLKLGAAPLVLSVALVSAPAFAQDAAEDGVATGGEIVVTGSLIRNPNLESSSPVNVTDENEIQLRQATSAELLLRETPGIVPNLGANVNNGAVGSARVDLRGLGANRNLVMLNSTRIVPSSFFGAVDLNNIPVALVERVDVLTGGASTTYGADAVTGVVNFITKRDFAGIDLSATQQISERGDANLFRTDLVIGANFDDGRGNAVISIGYIEADKLLFGSRGFAQCVLNSLSGFCGGDSPTATPTSFGITGVAGNRQVSADGLSLVPQYSLYNFNPANIYITPYERFNFYGEGRYDVSDSVTVYSRGLFSKNTVKTEIASSGIFGEELTINGDNPYLPAGIRDQLCGFAGIALGATCNTNQAIPLGAVYRRSVELGPRLSEYVTNIFDVKAGATFNITDGISFDIYGAYGESENTETRRGYVSRSRVVQALNASSTTACTNPANGCVPLNLFGPEGSITPEMGAFIGGITSSIQQYASLAQVRGVLSGSTGFGLPWASEEVSFAVGGEYRKYNAAQRPDNLAQVPGELGGAGGAVRPFSGAYDSTEAFAELIVPLVSDKPFFDDLTIEGGVRYSRYTVDAPGNPKFSPTSWKVGVNWAPVDSLKFRANYQKAVRAPNIGELFAPINTGLTNLATDPCAGAAPVGNANLTAVCLAQGAPLASIGNIQEPAAGQANVTGGGNPNVGPETAKTLTIGAVFTPRGLVPGLTLSLDYYRIKVTDAITAPLPGDIIAACFAGLSAASATNPACTAIRRNPATGRLSGSPATTPGLPAPLTNAGILFTEGYDLIVNYKRDLGFADLSWNFSGNHTRKATFQASETVTNFPNCAGIYSVNCGIAQGQLQPKWSWTMRTTLGFDGVDVSLLWRHLSSFRSQAGNLCGPGVTANGCTGFVRGDATRFPDIVGQPINLNRIKAYDYFDLTTRFSVTENFDLTLTAYNLLDKKPPLLGGQAGTTSANSGNTYPSTYDVIGRRYSATARLKF